MRTINLTRRKSISNTIIGTYVSMKAPCDDGVIDWTHVIDIVKSTGKNIIFSIEYGTIDKVRSFEHLSKLL
jgi:hypothetical protein